MLGRIVRLHLRGSRGQALFGRSLLQTEFKRFSKELHQVSGDLDRPGQIWSDLVTRGISASKLKNSKLWWNGPHWLQQPGSHWPVCETNAAVPGECLIEARKELLTQVTLFV